MTVKVFAKINLALAVTGVNRGLHALDTVMTSVNIADVVSVTKRRDGAIKVIFDGRNGEDTNAARAARLFSARFGFGGADITVKTAIPSGGGLGGSSADAAGVLAAMAEESGGVDRKALLSLAAEVGSDVPFMLTGGCARLRGTGAELETLPAPKMSFLLAGKGSVSTAEAFSLYDRIGGENRPAATVDEMCDCLARGDNDGAAAAFFNDLSPAAREISPYVREALSVMKGEGLTACVTGSGSFVFGYGDEEKKRSASSRLAARGFTVIRAETTNRGILKV